MNKLLASALVSLVAVGLSGSQASAGWLSCLGCNKCCYKYTLNCRPYNAFTPVCYGNIHCDGGCIPCMPGMPGIPPQGLVQGGMANFGQCFPGGEGTCQLFPYNYPGTSNHVTVDGRVITGTPVMIPPGATVGMPMPSGPVTTPQAQPASAAPVSQGVMPYYGMVQPTAYPVAPNMGNWAGYGYPVPMQPANAPYYWNGNR